MTAADAPPTTIVSVDIETTGLLPTHQVWEVGVVVRDVNLGVADDWECVWQLPVDVARADPVALQVGRFHERRLADGLISDPYAFAHDFAELTAGAWLVGANPSFDADFLSRLLRSHGVEPAWRYRLVCVESAVAGLTGSLPAGLRDTARLVGIDPDVPRYARHTAIGDARLALAVFDEVIGKRAGLAGALEVNRSAR